MENIKQLNIDKYLNWYERLTKGFPDYVNKKIRIQRLNKAVKYLEQRATVPEQGTASFFIHGLSLSRSFDLTIKHMFAFRGQIETLEKELDKDLNLYFNPELAQGGNDWYMPSKEDWQFLSYFRDKQLEESKTEFKTELERSVLTETALIEQKLENINHQLFVSHNYFENVRANTPLLKKTLKENTKVGGKIYAKVVGEGWGMFSFWVCNIDFGKWLHSQLSNERTNSTNGNSPKQTVEGIALFYWYLLKGGEDGLSNSDTLTNAVETFGVSRKTLQNKWNGIIEREIIIVPKNTNERKEKHNRLLFAYCTLKERSTNKKAIDLASQHLKQFETQMSKITNNQSLVDSNRG